MEPLGDGDPKRIGPYRLRARLGAGGMGRVYLGETRDKRVAAVKVLRAELASSPEFRQRFDRELTAARRVVSVRTAAVLDADPTAPHPWLATVYVPGPDLAEHVRATGPLSAGSVAALGAGLAEGLGAIHAHGIVHRDLKPGNVIVSDAGPVIIDFGISRAVDASTLTATGTVLGTYGYMAPEQITADTAGPASDVFALGCLLVFAATGKGPFEASTVPAVIHRVLADAPDLGGLTDGLHALVEACLAKDPSARPEVDELIARLPTLAGESTAPTRIDPAAGVFTGGPGFAPGRIDAATAVQASSVARTPPARADRGRHRLSRRTLLIGGAGLVAATAGTTGALAWSHRHRITTEPVGDLTFSRDGRYLAANYAGSGWSGGWIWETRTRDVIAEFTTGFVSGLFLASSPNSSMFVHGDGEGGVVFRDPATGGVARRIETPFEDVSNVAYSPDGRLLALCGSDHGTQPHSLVIVDVESGEQTSQIPDSQIGWVRSAAFTDAGDGLAFVGTIWNDDGDSTDSCWRWDLGTGELLQFGPSGEWYQLAMSPEGPLAVAGEDGCQLSPGTDVSDLVPLSAAPTKALAFSPDGSTLATADDGAVRMWDVGTAAEQQIIVEAARTTLAFNPDGTHLAMGNGSGFEDTGAWLWPLD